MDVLEVLRRNRHLASLSGHDLDALSRGFVSAKFSDSHTLFSQGDRADAVYLILEGEVVATRKERLRENVISRAHAGDLFGLIGVLRHLPRSASCKTAGPTEIATLSQEAVRMLLGHSAPIAYAFQRALSAQLARDLRTQDQRLRDLIVLLPR